MGRQAGGKWAGGRAGWQWEHKMGGNYHQVSRCLLQHRSHVKAAVLEW